MNVVYDHVEYFVHPRLGVWLGAPGAAGGVDGMGWHADMSRIVRQWGHAVGVGEGGNGEVIRFCCCFCCCLSIIMNRLGPIMLRDLDLFHTFPN